MNKFYKRLKALFGKFFGLLFRVKIINPQNEIQGTPFIVCSNHTSLWDVFIISLAMKNQIRYLAKKEVFKIPIFGWIIKRMGAIPVDRKAGDIGAIKKSIEILKNGDCMGVFPQGTRCPKQNPRDTEIKDGIGMLCSKTNVGILPVYIKTKKGKVRFFHRTYFIIGEYIPPEELKFDALGKEKYRLISTHAFDKTCALGESVVKI